MFAKKNDFSSAHECPKFGLKNSSGGVLQFIGILTYKLSEATNVKSEI